VLDVVKRSSTNTCCFTSGYGHFIQGTGSVLQMNEEIDTEEFFKDVTRWTPEDTDEQRLERVNKLRILGLRYFSPKEIANLMRFPDHFEFPSHLSSRQKYKLIGNSVNVEVIALMLKLLFIS
jgi:tRNA (cytosine38-C5)-methyltransferase